MNSVFISGIPTAGKTYLAEKIATKTQMKVVSVDSLRSEMLNDPKLEKWANFFWNQDEEKYYNETSCNEQWQNLVNQSEAFWPTILSKIAEIKKPFILEGVNVLPHLVKKDLQIDGVCLLVESEKIVFERLKVNSRWGNTDELKRTEAKAFYNCEGIKYKNEALEHGFQVFTNVNDAEEELLRMISS